VQGKGHPRGSQILRRKDDALFVLDKHGVFLVNPTADAHVANLDPVAVLFFDDAYGILGLAHDLPLVVGVHDEEINLAFFGHDLFADPRLVGAMGGNRCDQEKRDDNGAGHG
jgi:hypothetical protein